MTVPISKVASAGRSQDIKDPVSKPSGIKPRRNNLVKLPEFLKSSSEIRCLPRLAFFKRACEILKRLCGYNSECVEHSIHRTPVLLRSYSGMLLEYACEMLWIFESELVSNFTHRLI